MTDEGYLDLFNAIWGDIQPPLYAEIAGQQVRVIEGILSREYVDERGASLNSGYGSISLVASELPDGCKPKPGMLLKIRGQTYQMNQDVPPLPLCPTSELIKLRIHPV